MGISVMGRVRTSTVKKASRKLIENYYHKLTDDFDTNKRVIDAIADIRSKKLRNKIAGFTTYLVNRIAHSPIRGLSYKIKEQKHERFPDYSVHLSSLEVDSIDVDKFTVEMLTSLNLNTNLSVNTPFTDKYSQKFA